MGVSIAIGAAIGAGIGAIGGAVSGGGDKIWKGALSGAVAGSVTAGVGSWAGGAAAAGGLGWGGAAAGALAGGAGGVTGGLMNAALNGGTGADYLRGGLFGGLTGTALGGVTGYLGGANANNALPADAQGIPTTADGSYAFDDAVAGSAVDPNVASSLSGSTVGSAAIDPTLATPTPVTQPITTPTLADTVSTVASQQTPTTSQDLSSVVPTNPTAQTSPFSGESNFTFDDYPSQRMIDTGAANPMDTQAAADSYQFKLKDLGADMGLDTFGFGKGASQTGAGKMGEFGLKDYLKMQGYGSLLGGGVKTLGALATSGETAANRRNLMDLYNQQNQYNQYYNNKLQQTYDDPNAYLNTPEAIATRQQAMQKLLAQNAAAGRRTAGLAMQNQLMQNQLTNLAAYRRGIPQANYTSAGNLYNQGAAYSPTGDITTGLSSMFTPLSMYALSGLA